MDGDIRTDASGYRVDQGFERLAKQDAKHQSETIGSPKGFNNGDRVELIDPNEGAGTYIIGTEYVDNRSLKGELRTCVLIGAQSPAVWDEDRDQWHDTTCDRLEAWRFAVVRWSTGEEGLIGAQFLWAPFANPSQLAKPKLHFLNHDEMLALPDPEWMVEGLIMRRTSALAFGKSNSFKSFVAIDIGGSVATGQAWHGHAVAKAGHVLYIATEGALGIAKQRIPGWMEAHAVPAELRSNLKLYPREIALDDPNAIAEILQSCAVEVAHRGLARGERVWTDQNPRGAFDLIVVDIFGASMNGSEITDETARAWVRNINEIMRQVGCAVLTVAHTGWADETRARMHTHFWGSYDTRLKLVGDKDNLTTVLTVDRHKDADSSGEWGFRLDVVPTPTGGTTLVPRLCDDVEKGQKRRVSGKPAVALQALSDALLHHGRTIAGPNYPSCQVVAIDQWKAMCGSHGLTESDNPDALKKAFQRAKDALIEKGLVRQFDNQVWKAHPEV